MNILVLVKEVLEMASSTRIDDSGKWVYTFESSPFRMNRYDEYAVEEALSIRDEIPETTVTVLSVGPSYVARTIKRALGMGADRGVHLVTQTAGYLDPFVIASWIAGYAREKKYDLILAGVMSEDAMQGQVGPMTAELLGIPCATQVISRKFCETENCLTVERELEGGVRQLLEIETPAMLTLQTGINTPRLLSLSNVLRAGKERLETVAVSDLPSVNPRQELLELHYPKKKRDGVFLEGTVEDKAKTLLRIIKEKALLR